MSVKLAQISAETCFGSLTCRLDTTSRDTRRNVVAPTHERDEDHALAVQTGPLLRSLGSVDIDMRRRFVPPDILTGPVA